MVWGRVKWFDREFLLMEVYRFLVDFEDGIAGMDVFVKVEGQTFVQGSVLRLLVVRIPVLGHRKCHRGRWGLRGEKRTIPIV
jgi:hypothetical protein